MLSITLFLLSSFFIIHEYNKEEARVNKIQGLYFYLDAEPLSKYEKIGEIDIKFTWSTKYSYMKNSLVTKAKEKFKDAEGIIVYEGKEGVLTKADVIKFK